MTRGGKRPGAGKPALPDGSKRKNVSFRLAPETVELCKEIKAEGYQLGRLIDDLLAAFARHAGIIPPETENDLQE